MCDPYTAAPAACGSFCVRSVILVPVKPAGKGVSALSSERCRWGLAPREWGAARERLVSLLEETARRRATVTYGEAAAVAFEGRFSARSGALMDLLGEVDDLLDAQKGVMIASLVVRKDSGMPGDGYFKFARDHLGRDVSDVRSFWLAEARRVWDAYGPEVA